MSARDKKESFDATFLRKICPSGFDSFEVLPSQGASGGILIAWKSSVFSGEQIFSNEFAISVQLSSALDNTSWVLTLVYGPCSTEGKLAFTNWFKGINMNNDTNWMILGDFNLIRKPEDRNKPGGT